MEDSSGYTVKIEPKVEKDDWRTELTPDVRQKVVNRILGGLRDQVPSADPSTLNRLTDLAVQFEEKMFCNSETKDSYIYAISKKMTPMRKFCRPGIAASSSNPEKEEERTFNGLTQTSMVDGVGHSSGLQNVSGFSHDFVGNSVGQELQSNIGANTQRQMPRSQPSEQVVYQQHQRRELQNQFLKHKVQQQNICASPTQPNFHDSHQHQQQQYIVSQPSQIQYSQQPLLPIQPHQQTFGHQSNATVFQRLQQLGRQNNVSEQQQQSLFQQNMLNSSQQPLCLQSDLSGVQQPQKMLAPQSNVLSLQPHQHSSHILQQADITASPQQVQRTLQPVQRHQLLVSQKQSNSSQEGTQQRLQTSTVLLQPQNTIDQQKLLQSQIGLPEDTSAELAALSRLANVADWHDHAYQKLQSMREDCIPQLKFLHMRFEQRCQLAPKPELAERFKNNIIAIEKMVKFLSMSRSDLVGWPKEKFDYYQRAIILFLNSFQPKNSRTAQQPAQLHPPADQSQMSQLLQHRNAKLQFHPVNLAMTSSPVSSSPLSSSQQWVSNTQANMISSLQSGSQMGLEQRNAPGTMQHAARLVDQNVVGAQQTSHNTCMNASDDVDIISFRQGSTTVPFQQQNQQKHQLMHHQHFGQHIQLQQKPMQNIQTMLSTTPHQLRAPSPQTSQYSSPLIDQQNLLSPLSKVGTPSRSANPPLITASPSTPLTPSSIPADLEKYPSGISPQSIPENVGHPLTPVPLSQINSQTQMQNQSLDVGMPGISASPLLTEFINPDANQQSSPTKQPIERLLKAVEAISPEALSASICEIGLVVNAVDAIAETAADSHSNSGSAVTENLASQTRFYLQTRDFSSQDQLSFSTKLKRKISAMAVDALSPSFSETDILKQSNGQICDLDSPTSRIKGLKIEPNKALLDEIRYINRQLVETVIDLDSMEYAATIKAGGGTVVRCSYIAVGINENLKLHNASSQMLIVRPLRLLVPASYPNSSPVILGSSTVDCSHESKESEDLSEKTKVRFSMNLCKLLEPISLGEMVRTWDACARAVFLEYAQAHGGGCFSSKFGTWENCITAS